MITAGRRSEGRGGRRRVVGVCAVRHRGIHPLGRVVACGSSIVMMLPSFPRPLGTPRRSPGQAEGPVSRQPRRHRARPTGAVHHRTPRHRAAGHRPHHRRARHSRSPMPPDDPGVTTSGAARRLGHEPGAVVRLRARLPAAPAHRPADDLSGRPGAPRPGARGRGYLEGAYTQTYRRSPPTPRACAGCSAGSPRPAASQVTSGRRQRPRSTTVASSAPCLSAKVTPASPPREPTAVVRATCLHRTLPPTRSPICCRHQPARRPEAPDRRSPLGHPNAPPVTALRPPRALRTPAHGQSRDVQDWEALRHPPGCWTTHGARRPPQPATRQPGPQHLQQLDHTNLPERHRPPPVIRPGRIGSRALRPPRRTTCRRWSHIWQPGGPMNVARTGSARSHARGERQPATASACAPGSPRTPTNGRAAPGHARIRCARGRVTRGRRARPASGPHCEPATTMPGRPATTACVSHDRRRRAGGRDSRSVPGGTGEGFRLWRSPRLLNESEDTNPKRVVGHGVSQ